MANICQPACLLQACCSVWPLTVYCRPHDGICTGARHKAHSMLTFMASGS